jgi:hypothetical protein
MERSTPMGRLFFKQTKSFQERLLDERQKLLNEADRLPNSLARDKILERVRQFDSTANIAIWLTSAELRAPK